MNASLYSCRGVVYTAIQTDIDRVSAAGELACHTADNTYEDPRDLVTSVSSIRLSTSGDVW